MEEQRATNTLQGPKETTLDSAMATFPFHLLHSRAVSLDRFQSFPSVTTYLSSEGATLSPSVKEKERKAIKKT